MTEPRQTIYTAPEFEGSAKDNVEMLAALGGKVVIAGKEFPAPAAATVALLDALDSPFVSGTAASAGMVDVCRALYVLGAREKACLPALQLMRRREAQEEQSGGAGGSDLSAALAGAVAKELADAEAAFDAAALAFCQELGAFSYAQAALDIGKYLSMATGFSMIPHDGADAQKKTSGRTSTT